MVDKPLEISYFKSIKKNRTFCKTGYMERVMGKFEKVLDHYGTQMNVVRTLEAYTGKRIPRQTVSSWKKNDRVPAKWALIIEAETKGYLPAREIA